MSMITNDATVCLPALYVRSTRTTPHSTDQATNMVRVLLLLLLIPRNQFYASSISILSASSSRIILLICGVGLSFGYRVIDDLLNCMRIIFQHFFRPILARPSSTWLIYVQRAVDWLAGWLFSVSLSVSLFRGRGLSMAGLPSNLGWADD